MSRLDHLKEEHFSNNLLASRIRLLYPFTLKAKYEENEIM